MTNISPPPAASTESDGPRSVSAPESVAPTTDGTVEIVADDISTPAQPGAPPASTEIVDPFAHAVDAYIAAGWNPITLPFGEKSPPEGGFTGAGGRPPTEIDHKRWKRNGPNNIALVMPDGIVGIDVDEYAKGGTTKVGAASLAKLVEAHGPLPLTYSSTSRGDENGPGLSRIMLFKVPVGTRLKANPATSIEAIQHHHRYAAVWPSIHPDARRYEWYDDADELMDGPPNIDDIPELPWSWVEGLSVDANLSRERADAATTAEVTEFIEANVNDLAPRYLDRLIDDLVAAYKPGSARHDTLRTFAWAAMRDAAAGIYPAQRAIDKLAEWWQSVMAEDPKRLEPNHYGVTEFDALIAYMIGQVLASPDVVEDARLDMLRRIAPTVHVDPHTAEALTVPADINDTSMAHSFGQSLVGRYLYVAAHGRWYRWTGKQWLHDDMLAIQLVAREFILKMMHAMVDAGERHDRLKSVGSYRSERGQRVLEKFVRSEPGIAAQASEFDSHPDLLNCQNGTVRLADGVLLPHDPADRLTNITTVDYVPGASHPDIETLFDSLAPDAAAAVICSLGQAVFGTSYEDLLWIWNGGGANGKTVLVEAVRAALGSGYASPVPAKLMMQSGREDHPTIIANLLGKRLVFISELEEGGRLKMESMKSLTGGDTLTGRFIGKDYFDFDPSHTTFMLTNHLPIVNDSTHAATRRLKCVPFTKTFVRKTDAKPGDLIADEGLRRRVKDGKAQREAMLSVIVSGAVEYTTNGIPRSETIEAATSAWLHDEDVIARFIEDELGFHPTVRFTGADLYMKYQFWCEGEGRKPKNNNNFAKEFMAHRLVVEAGVEKGKNSEGRKEYRGVGLSRDVTCIAPRPVASATASAVIPAPPEAPEALPIDSLEEQFPWGPTGSASGASGDGLGKGSSGKPKQAQWTKTPRETPHGTPLCTDCGEREAASFTAGRCVPCDAIAAKAGLR